LTAVEPKSSNELAEARTRMAAGRNMMAAERTLMAWIRTSLSLMSFGFTIYKLLQGFQSGGSALPSANSPRNMGLFLTGMGAVAVILGTIEYVGIMRELRKEQPMRVLRSSLVMAIVMAAANVFLFFGILTKVL